jgi:hypothetical protein
MRGLLFGFVGLLAITTNASAAKLSQASLMGRWCGDVASYSFSRSALTVTRKGQKTETIKIKDIRVLDDEIQVFFADPYGGGSRFSEFGADGRSMAQQGSTFGAMPKRLFRRC